MKKFSIVYSVLSVLLYIFGCFVGVYMWVVFDVNVALKELQDVDPANWPNMDPRNRFLFIPIFSILVMIVGAAASAIFYNLGWRIKKWWSWIFIGFSYSIFFLILALSRFFGLGRSSLFCIFLMILCLVLIYHFFGERKRSC